MPVTVNELIFILKRKIKNPHRFFESTAGVFKLINPKIFRVYFDL